MERKKILVVGGVAGGATAAARLRRLDEHSEIILFEKGEYISYANCGLPYYIGDEIRNKSALTLQTPQSFHRRFNIDVRVHNEVIAIDRAAKCVEVMNHTNGEVYTETYDKLILAPGAEPAKLPVAGAESERVFSLRTIPDTYKIKEFLDKKKPQTAVVLGSGFIGLEMAENLHAAGVAVTMVIRKNQILAPIDFDMACDIHRHMEAKGVKVLFNDALQGIRETPDGLLLSLKSGEIHTEMLISAIGIVPDTAFIQEAGIKTNERGGIIVDTEMHTSDPDIYAVGDAIEITNFVSEQKAMIPLAGPANKQGRIVADRICGIESSFGGTQGSSVIKIFDMTVAFTGINEKTAQRLSLNYDKSFTYSPSHATYYPGASNMSIKTIFEKETGKILGAQIVGYEGVDKRCDVFATAIRFGATANDLTKLELCYAPPYSSAKDPVNMAGFVIENLLGKKVKNFHWQDVAGLPRDGSVSLLDVRTPSEYAGGSIDGFINIPLDEIRQRLDEIDVEKPVYVTCQMGLRGYNACRILSQNGYDCYNLSGGYRLYNSINKGDEIQTDSTCTNPEAKQ